MGDLAQSVRAGERKAIAKAITLVESRRAADEGKALALLDGLIPHAGQADRIGVTGIPGAGKSTLIDAFGAYLLDKGRRVAVLAVDPSSARTGGSILGDKTRMNRLSRDRRAFIRPSPTGGKLGGVTRTTREALIVLEAAGYDTIFVETVGTGQAEHLVADMVDLFMVLAIPGAGDELQGIKKGVLELADLIVVNKADGDRKQAAAQAVRDLKAALGIVGGGQADWRVPVLMTSATEQTGFDRLLETLEAHREQMAASGAREARRKDQRVRWLWAQIEDRLLTAFRGDKDVQAELKKLEAAVREGETTASAAARALVDRFRGAE